MATFFFYGTLCHAPLLAAVLGRDVASRPARLPAHSVVQALEGPFPLLLPGGEGAEGVVVSGLTEDDLDRLTFYEAGFAFDIRDMDVLIADGVLRASLFVPRPSAWTCGGRWSHADWAERWGALVTATARDVMALRGRVDPAVVVARYRMMLMRAGARLRAAGEAGPTTLRRQAEGGDVQVLASRQAYANYFAVEEYDLRHRRFDGAMSADINRAVFVTGDAAIVLPYDPVRDRVMVIEQFRVVPVGRGDPQPWMIEAIAGRVDGGETPQDAALREAREEAGIEIARLVEAVHAYPSPGTVAEYLYSYVGIADLPDGIAGTAGLLTEAEDIRSHLLSFDRLMALVDTGEVNSMPLILLAYWLARNRERLRAIPAGLEVGRRAS